MSQDVPFASPEELQVARKEAFAAFDGTTVGYVRYLSGLSDDRLRELGAI